MGLRISFSKCPQTKPTFSLPPSLLPLPLSDLLPDPSNSPNHSLAWIIHRLTCTNLASRSQDPSVSTDLQRFRGHREEGASFFSCSHLPFRPYSTYPGETCLTFGKQARLLPTPTPNLVRLGTLTPPPFPSCTLSFASHSSLSPLPSLFLPLLVLRSSPKPTAKKPSSVDWKKSLQPNESVKINFEKPKKKNERWNSFVGRPSRKNSSPADFSLLFPGRRLGSGSRTL